jgi:hypothetical protein
MARPPGPSGPQEPSAWYQALPDQAVWGLIVGSTAGRDLKSSNTAIKMTINPSEELLYFLTPEKHLIAELASPSPYGCALSILSGFKLREFLHARKSLQGSTKADSRHVIETPGLGELDP